MNSQIHKTKKNNYIVVNGKKLKVKTAEKILSDNNPYRLFLEIGDLAICSDEQIYKIHIGGIRQFITDVYAGWVKEAYRNLKNTSVIYNSEEKTYDDVNLETETVEEIIELLQQLQNNK
jgi:hypothetical protein